VQVWRQEAPPVAVDDATLVERIRQRDEDAFSLLYMRYAAYLAGVVYRLLGSDDELDDVLQESFVDAAEGIGKLEDPTRLRWWLATIAVRRVQRVLVSRRRHQRLASGLALVAPQAHVPSTEWSIEELRRALDAIPPKLRVPWVLNRIEQLELADVSDMCGISLATAKRRIALADTRLRRRLDAR
jgi:RNA polymerase sigma-70 factor (ECF subfamily)